MHWLFLVAAIMLEVAGTTAMKLSAGFSRPLPSVAMFVLYAGSLTMLTMALKVIDVSVAYAVWSGLGTALIVAIGIAWFHEAVNVPKVACIGLIIAGVVGLNLFGSVHTDEPLPSLASSPTQERDTVKATLP